MHISGITAVYFSATGNTKFVTEQIAKSLAEALNVPLSKYDFTLPQNRETVLHYSCGEVVVFGVPVYAGRIPNKILPAVQNNFKSDGALAVPVVTFGNRNFDDALIELRIELEKNGFHTVAAAAAACRHAFSEKLALGRPNTDDVKEFNAFAASVAEKTSQAEKIPAPMAVPGHDPVGPYYTPLKTDGTPAKFLKAKPLTRAELCNNCGICAAVCPMGSIDRDNAANVSGVCIKCQACVRSCPKSAKYFNDPDLASHIDMLEHNYARRAESRFFV